MIPTMVASIGGAPAHAVVLAIFAALVAVGDAAGKSLLFYGLKANVVIRKLAVELVASVAKVGRDGLSGIHGKHSMPFILLVVKG